MSLADVTFINMCRDILENGTRIAIAAQILRKHLFFVI